MRLLKVFLLPMMFAGSALAQSGASVTNNCANHLNTSEEPKVEALLSCLAEMQRAIDRLAVASANTNALSQEEINAIAAELAANHADDIRGDKGDPGAEGDDMQIPSGAVLAFDRANGCPVGWKADISEAQGRMIVGVDGQNFRLPYEGGVPKYQTGGRATHTLEVPEIANHVHGGKVVSAQLPPGDQLVVVHPRGNSGSDRSDVVSWLAGHDGETDEHNNMPPYIALYFCKKE